MNEQFLSGRLVLVTGASRGIGRAIVLTMAQKGARIIINYRNNLLAAQETQKMILDKGYEVPIVQQFDVGDADAVSQGISQLIQLHGTIDILVNNAGVVKDSLLVRTTTENWRHMMQTNLDGAFFCSRACAKGMIKKRWGRIINITSVSAQTGIRGQAAYAAAKAGVIGMSKALASELGSRNITVNTVAPGWIDTDMSSAHLAGSKGEAILSQIPLGRVGIPQDIAGVVAFLASNEAQYITGQTLAVNGGLYM